MAFISSRGRLLAGVVLLVLIGAFFALRGTVSRASSPPAPSPRPVMAVTVQKAAYLPMRRTVEVTGTVYAIDPLSIGSEATGLRIERVPVEEHDQVRKGQLLAQLDGEVLSAQLQQDEARLAAARAALSKARQPNRPQDIDGLRSAVSQAKATLEKDKADLIQAEASLRNDEDNARRYENLLAQGFVSLTDTRNARTLADRDKALVAAARHQVSASQAAVSQAESRLQLGMLGGMREDVQTAAANMAEIEGQIRQLRAQLSQTLIVAPDDGLIMERDAHVGDIAAAGKTLFVMARRSRLELRAKVAEADLMSMRIGQTVQISGHGKTVEGRIWLISPQVDASTRLGTARVELPHGSGYRPGMFVRGVVDQGTHQALSVPLKAVLGTAEQPYVMVCEDSIARRRLVKVGQSTTSTTEIASGLQAEAAVIVDGAGLLNDGDRVTVSQ